MRPELFTEWEQALGSLAEAEELWTAGKFHDAAEMATMAVVFASIAIRQLAKELNMPALLELAYNLFLEVDQKRKIYRTPKVLMEWARSTLRRVHSELPPDTFPPLRV